MLGKRLKGYAKTLELKVNSQAVACVRQRPGDCRKEFQINLERTEHRDVTCWQKYQPPDTSSKIEISKKFECHFLFTALSHGNLVLNWSSRGRNYVQIPRLRDFIQINSY